VLLTDIRAAGASGGAFLRHRLTPAARVEALDLTAPQASRRHFPHPTDRCRFRRRPFDWMAVASRTVKGTAMQYLLLIYENEANRQSVDRSKMMEEYGKFTRSIIESGNFKAGDALQPTSSATTVRVKDGKPVVTHGPFAETREALLGYYLIDAKNLDDALAIAGRVPSARIGSIEVRPIMVYN
jgi:hypothetical protein